MTNIIEGDCILARSDMPADELQALQTGDAPKVIPPDEDYQPWKPELMSPSGNWAYLWSQHTYSSTPSPLIALSNAL